MDSKMRSLTQLNKARLVFCLALTAYMGMTVSVMMIPSPYVVMCLTPGIFFGFGNYMLLAFGLGYQKHRMMTVGGFAMFKFVFASILLMIGLASLLSTVTCYHDNKNTFFLMAVSLCVAAFFFYYIALYYYRFHETLMQEEKDATFQAAWQAHIVNQAPQQPEMVKVEPKDVC
ncbi:hypothetical protein L596_009949 [Steinernema carpocapsae]|uniref:Transmembrane protein n=1 Tax=Steinernema carpocapsae TaxID=34508 RepID=A0A4U5PI57_STECR|nr:hypothetical protein L596_009949 [Steinernema carpocapsae]